MEIMEEDALDIKVIRAGNDNLFRSEIFSNTVASLIGQSIEIYNTTGAIGAARAACIEFSGLEDYSQSISSIDRLIEVKPQKETDAYLLAYQKWKSELERKILKL